MNITTKNILNLLEKNNISANKLSTACGLNNSAISEWKKGKTNPSQKVLEKIAEYFDVPLSYFYQTDAEHEVKEKPTSEDMDLSRFREILSNKGLSVNDVKNLSDNQLSTIADIIKNFKQ